MSAASNRSTDAFRNLPPTTLSIVAICVSIYVVQGTLGWDLHLFTMCPRAILFTHEYYRIFTSVFFHANFMHIGMNMLSAAAISSALEKKLGTLKLLYSIWLAILFTSAIYIVVAYSAYSIFGYNTWMYQHSLGYSGILFHLSVLESRLNPGPRNVFGLFSVPSFAYPWVLLILLQLIMPNLSFLGHLAGIVNGTLEYYGVLHVFFVGDSFFVSLESLPFMTKLVSLDSFVAVTQGSGRRLRAESTPSRSVLVRSMRNTLCSTLELTKDAIGAMLLRMNCRNCRISQMNLRFWKRRPGNVVECGVIRPPEFYDGSLDETNDTNDSEQEHEPLSSQMV